MKKIDNKKRFIRIAVLVAILITIEQLTKLYAIKNTMNEEKIIIPNVLSFSYLENTGIAFGIAQGENNGVIILLNAVVIAMIIKFMIDQNKKIGTKTMFLLSMAVSGRS